MKITYRCISTRICQLVPVPVSKKKFSTVQDQYQYSPSTDSTTTSTTNIDLIWPRKNEIFDRKISFSCRKFKFRGAILNFWVWNWNLKRKIWHILENFMAANLFTWLLLFIVLVLVLVGSILARSVPVQSQYLKIGQYQYQFQYQYISTKNDQWTEKNQYQYQWTDSSIK